MALNSDPHGRRARDIAACDQDLSAFYRAIVSDVHRPWAEAARMDDAEHRLKRILPLCRRARITRLADLTGLDRIGLPVVQAIRPAALSEVTSLGRGLTTTEAAVGAAMESLERYYAESIPPEGILFATADDLEIVDGLFEKLLVPDCRESWRTKTIPWIMGIDVATGLSRWTSPRPKRANWTSPVVLGEGDASVVLLQSSTGLDAIKWAKEVEKRGAGEILLTSIDADGTENGYDIELTKAICKSVRVPVITSGGCGSARHMLDVFDRTDVDAALAASIFHYEKSTVDKVKKYLKRSGVRIRI